MNYREMIGRFAFISIFLICACGSNLRNSQAGQSVNLSLPATNGDQIQKLDNGRYKKNSGWEIPDLRLFEAKSSDELDQTTEDETRIKVKQVIYMPLENYLTVEPWDTLPDIKMGNTMILTISEYSYRGKIYGYGILAGRTKPGQKKGEAVQEGPGFVYRYLDEDGDGLFELLVAESSKIKIPRWVYKQET